MAEETQARTEAGPEAGAEARTQSTGAVRYIGTLTQSVYELAQYREDMSAEVKTGDVIEGIPFERIKSFLANANFEAADDIAKEADSQRQADRAARINGVAVRSGVDPSEVQEVPSKPIEDMSRDELEAFASRVGIDATDKGTKALREEIQASETPGGAGEAEDAGDAGEAEANQEEAPGPSGRPGAARSNRRTGQAASETSSQTTEPGEANQVNETEEGGGE